MKIVNGKLLEINKEKIRGEVIIPNEVTSIGENTFSYCKNLTSVIIPNWIMNIESGAFLKCTKLEKVVFQNNLESIADCMFQECTSLKTIDIPSSVTNLGNSVFYECQNLKNITIPSGVRSIGNWTLASCESLEKIKLPSSLKIIGEYSFHGCKNLKEILIPEGVTSIGEYTFSYCENLTKITLSSSVETIGKGLFADCARLEEVIFQNSKISQIHDCMFHGCRSLKSINIPSSVTCIGEGAFTFCEKLLKINIPSGVAIIKGSAFLQCKNITKVIIPSSVESIGECVFENCENLEEVIFQNNPESISYCMFQDCKSLKNIVIPNSVKSIDDGAFQGCENLPEMIIPSGVTTIGSLAFYQCKNLINISLPDDVIDIGSEAFSECINLEKIILPKKLKTINDYLFEKCENLEEIIIPSGVISIGKFAFYQCKSLKQVKIQNPNCNIAIDAFYCTDKLLWMYINEDGSVEICENKKEVKEGYQIEIDFYKEENKKFLNGNYRLNYLKLYQWKKEGEIEFIPLDYTLMTFPHDQIEKYFIHDNCGTWGKLVKKLGLVTLDKNEKDNSLTDLMKIYYAIGGFSSNQGERDRAYNYVINYVNRYFKDAPPSEIGKDIHRRFSKIQLNGEYNKDFATFFMRYFNDNPDFMNASELYKNSENHDENDDQDYLCNACNSFSNIQKLYPNRVVNGNEERALLSPLFVAAHCNIVSYNYIDEGNELLANLVGRYGYTQEQFERIQRIYNEAKKNKDNYVIKANKDDEENNVTFRLLEKDDPLGFVLGDITNCCQHIGGQASSCVEDGYKNKNAGFMVFEETGTKRILGQAYIWYDSKTKTICYDNIEIPTKVLEKLKKQSSKIKTEDLLSAIERSAKSIMKVMNKEEIKVERVTTGEGYNDLNKELEEHYTKEESPRALRGENIYSDAKETQYIIRTYDEITTRYSKEIKEDISEARKILSESISNNHLLKNYTING